MPSPKSSSSSSSKTATVLWGFLLVAVGCIGNNLFLEQIVSRKVNPHADPGAGGLLTLLQFAFVSLASAPSGVEWRGFGRRGGGLLGALRGLVPVGLRARTVPLRHYAGMTALFFSMSVLNNAAYKFNISQPMHMVFRSANLMVTYALGRLLFGKKYTQQELLAVVLLTLGALSATAAEALWGDTATAAAAGDAARRALAQTAGGASPSPCAGSGCGGDAGAASGWAALASRALFGGVGGGSGGGGENDGTAYMLRWSMGILILTSVLVLQTFLGNYQNWSATTYGRAPYEGMFWCHTLPLPAFLLTARGLAARAAAWSATPALSAVLPPGSALATLLRLTAADRLPLMWALVLGNAITQYICVSGVYQLQSVSDPLTVNVTLTVRKCVSLLLSIWLFGNTFTPPHWLGAAFVFGGALLYGIDVRPRGKDKAEGQERPLGSGARAGSSYEELRFRGGGGSGPARRGYWETRQATAPQSPLGGGGAAAVAARRSARAPAAHVTNDDT